jgi:hypothetical protein
MAEPSIKDLAYRTAASVFGGPVDLATMVMRPFGYKTPDTQVVGSSEYIGKQLERAGLISSARSPLTEFIASVAVPTPGGFAKGAALAAPALGGIFVGKGAKTWDALAAQKAKIMADMGADPRTIWQETGTWKGPDGKWRQEISDQPAKITEDVVNQIVESKQFKGPLGQAITHAELFKAYPETAGIPSTIFAQELPTGNVLGGRSGTFQIPQLTVGGPSTVAQRSVALHELQHAVQQKEGFARGGSAASLSPDIAQARFDLKEIEQKMVRLQDAASDEARLYISKSQRDPEFKKIIDEAFNKYKTQFGERSEENPFGVDLQDAVKFSLLEKSPVLNNLGLQADKLRRLSNLEPFEAYRNLAGEAEARAVQQRRNLSSEQRRAAFPEESYDVPLDQLIIRTD